jgi:carboxyl-terminal processing protease
MREFWKKVGLISLGIAAGVMLSLNFSAVANREAPLGLPLDDLRVLSDVFGKIKTDYVENVTDKKLIREAINGMVSGLDPHSQFLDEEAFKDLQTSTVGRYGGLGIEVNLEDGFVKVITPMDEQPAARAGILSGDLIYKVDDTLIRGLPLQKAIEKMKGPAGTKAILGVYRKGESQPMTFTVTREIINVQSVKAKLIEPGYGWIHVRQFQERTGEDLVKALKTLYKDGDLKGLVLDLRDDPGGLLHNAVAVSAAFLPADVLVVYTDGRIPESKMRLTASREHYMRGRGGSDYLKDVPAGAKTVPLTVLINTGSASASEIVAGALQDHKRATLIGTQTFGKGSVQSVLQLGQNIALKLTTARYYTPNGRSIQAKGIEPDFAVEQVSFDGRGTIVRVREADLNGHLENERALDKGASAKAAAIENEDGATRQKPPVEKGSKDDYQLAQAMNYLKGQPIVPSTKDSKQQLTAHQSKPTP